MNVAGRKHDHLTSQAVQAVHQNPHKWIFCLLHWDFLTIYCCEKTSLCNYVLLAVWLELQLFRFDLKWSVIFMMGLLIFCLEIFKGELQNCKAMYLCVWSSDANAFHTLYQKIILITALKSKTSLLKKEDCQNIERYAKRNQNYPFLNIFWEDG